MKHPRRQRGAALLTAMIIVTLVVTLAASMVWQQWRAVQVEAAERARAQSAWILAGALDWARLILREDLRSGRPTALTEPWAVPLAEARLSTFLAADKNNNASDEAGGPEAFLSGAIADAQGRYNLTNLVSNNQVQPGQVAALGRLCQTLGVEGAVAGRIADRMRDAMAGADASAPLLPQSVQQLTWLGIDPATVAALEPFVVVLPGPTELNVNTAPREVLTSVPQGSDVAAAERILQIRQRTPFRSTNELFTQLPQLKPPPTTGGTAAQASPGPGGAGTPAAITPPALTVRSAYFEVRGRLRLDDRILEERSLVQRMPNGQVVLLERQRVASRESVGT